MFVEVGFVRSLVVDAARADKLCLCFDSVVGPDMLVEVRLVLALVTALFTLIDLWFPWLSVMFLGMSL